MDEKQLISIVVPVLNETDVIEVFYERCKKVLTSLESFNYEIIFIDDGSKDYSYTKMVRLADFDQNVTILKFSRNFGHQIAITAGMDIAIGKGHTELPEKTLCLGNCTARFKKENPYVPGCPPVASEILKMLTGRTTLDKE